MSNLFIMFRSVPGQRPLYYVAPGTFSDNVDNAAIMPRHEAEWLADLYDNGQFAHASQFNRVAV